MWPERKRDKGVSDDSSKNIIDGAVFYVQLCILRTCVRAGKSKMNVL